MKMKFESKNIYIVNTLKRYLFSINRLALIMILFSILFNFKGNGSIEAFSKAILLNNKNERAYNYRGFSKFNLKDVKGACEDWKIAAQLGNSQSAQMLATYCK